MFERLPSSFSDVWHHLMVFFFLDVYSKRSTEYNAPCPSVKCWILLALNTRTQRYISGSNQTESKLRAEALEEHEWARLGVKKNGWKCFYVFIFCDCAPWTKHAASFISFQRFLFAPQECRCRSRKYVSSCTFVLDGYCWKIRWKEHSPVVPVHDVSALICFKNAFETLPSWSSATFGPFFDRDERIADANQQNCTERL